MPKYEITIQARYLVEIDNLSEVREQITNGYENPTLPAFIPEDSVEYLDGFISYEKKRKEETND
jgi:hypothetical protein